MDEFLLFPLLLTVGACSKQADPPSAREMYDSMSKMVTGSAYPSHWCTIIVVIVSTITIIIIAITITIMIIVINIVIILTLATGGRSATPAWPPSHPRWRPRWTRRGRA